MAHPIPAYIFFAVFVLSAAVHLAGCLWGRPKTAYTKPLLVSSLALTYAFAAPAPSWVLILALFLSWLGDVLLIPKGHKWFTMGGIAFMFSHLFFVLLYSTQISPEKLHILPILLLAAAYFGFSLFIIRKIRRNTPKAMVPPMYFYLFCNSAMNIFAMMQLLSRPSLAAAVAYIGALLFYASDCCLYLVRYGDKPEIIFKKHFTVMLTYLLGELLIVVGMMMLQR